jgi:dipeptidyl aminopeptidase/acylaminoacyl peptidase
MDVPNESVEPAKPRRLTDIDANHSEVAWMPDSTALLTTHVDEVGLDEPGRHASIYRIDLENGVQTCLTDDSHTDSTPVFSADGRFMAWMRYPAQQMALKYTRLAVCDTQTGEITDVTLTIDVNPVSAVWARNTLYFNAQVHGRIWIYGLAALNQAAQPIIEFDGRADRFDVSADGTIAYVGFNAETLAEVYVRTSDGETRQLSHFNAQLRDETHIPVWHGLTWEREGVEIEGWYALPSVADSDQKLPLILDIHGGPHIMWSPHYENEWHNWQTVLSAGYAIFIANPRGSTGYGEAYQMAIHGAWGDRAQADILTGLEKFLDLGLVDTARMGIMGGSYGGYMTAWITARDHRFKAALAERGVYNLISFTGTTDIPTFIPDEFGLELPDDPSTLWAHSPLAYAHQIQTPLFIIHSENDFRVAISEGEQLFAAVRRAGNVPVEFVRYPREGHELSRAGEPEHRIDRLNRIVGWFDRWLK